MLIRFWRDDRAATAIEYCILAGFISILIVGGVTMIGNRLSTNYFGKFGAALN